MRRLVLVCVTRSLYSQRLRTSINMLYFLHIQKVLGYLGVKINALFSVRIDTVAAYLRDPINTFPCR